MQRSCLWLRNERGPNPITTLLSFSLVTVASFFLFSIEVRPSSRVRKCAGEDGGPSPSRFSALTTTLYLEKKDEEVKDFAQKLFRGNLFRDALLSFLGPASRSQAPQLGATLPGQNNNLLAHTTFLHVPQDKR